MLPAIRSVGRPVGPICGLALMNTRTLAEIAALCGAEIDASTGSSGASDVSARPIDGPATLRDATPRELSFLGNPRYRSELATTRAAAVLVSRTERRERADLVFLRCADPNAAFTRVVQAFAPAPARPAPGVHPSAVVDPSAELGEHVSIGPHAFVGAGARVGAQSIVHAQVCIGAGVRVGESCELHPGVVLYERVELGSRVIVHAGSVLGSDGFGYEPTREGWRKIPQCGTVIVEDDVEIGANVCIDRARFGSTRIGRGVKIDNLVHLAHNVVIGDGALIIAQVGIAGSTRIGARAVLAGQAGLNGHIEIGERARIGAQAGVFGDVPAGADVIGWPARPRIAALRQTALVERLPEIYARLRELEEKLGVDSRNHERGERERASREPREREEERA